MGQACCKGATQESPQNVEHAVAVVGGDGAHTPATQNAEAGHGGDVVLAEHLVAEDIITPIAPVRNFAVFLNHRGPDVKKGFVDHLCASLDTAGVHSFVDYKELHVGDDTWDAIASAIRHSKIHIAIFSPGYAHSSWCLKELHEILECRANGSSDLFLPVFYKVAPSDLRSSTSPNSCYSSAFANLFSRYDPNLIQVWKTALYQASMVNGWTLDGAAQGFEGRLVKLIVSEVLNVLNRTLLDVAKHPVGVKEKLQEALNLVEIDKARKGVHTLGIFGMGGVGKTTLAKSIYNGIYREFECCSFMQSVRSEAKTPDGLRGVQERMIRALLKNESISVTSTSHGKQIMKDRLPGLKILIILDDVDAREQLDELLPPIESCHLMDGSQILITTRDEQIVIWAKAQQSLYMQGLSGPDAHLLFSWHAFLRQEEPSEDFKKLAKKVVDACQGLPLALEVLGSHLYNKDLTFWEGTVKVLEGHRRTLAPAQREVTSILRISFDGLSSEEERSMFLDIACFLLGEHEARAKRIWRESDAAELCLETLRLKSLVKLDQDRRLTMHDLLRDMGREIVERSHRNIWQRSHLWNDDDVRFVLRNKKATSDMRGVCLAMKDHEEWDTKSFGGMDVLQLLVLSNGNITGDFSLFSKELRWFQWRYCPLESFPLDLALDHVAVLDLMGSKLSRFFPGHMVESLRELNLSKCSDLKELPEFSDVLNNLEMIDLGSCANLESLPESIGCLSSSLTHLNLSECSKLTTLPDGIVHLHCLKSLLLNKCVRLTRLPDAFGQLTALQEIGLEEVSFELLPESFGNLTSLLSLHLHASSRLRKLPSTIGNLRKLTSFTISRCPLICEIPEGASSLTNLVNLEATYCKSMSLLPENIGNLHKLVTLKLHHNPKLVYVPSSIRQLQELVTLELGDCAISDEGLPKLGYSTFSSLQKLLLQYNALSRLPEDFHLLVKLQILELHHCKNLREIPHLPPSLTVLDIGDCPAMTRLSCLSSLENLRDLVLCNCTGLRDLMGLDCLSHLEELNISGCTGLTTLPPMEKLTSLRLLHLAGSGVSLLQDDAPWISKLVSLEHVSLYGDELPECLSNCERDFQRVTNKQYAEDCCMEAKVPEGNMVCKGVVCCLVSHDQGWSDYPWDHGRYSSSYTNVQAKVMGAEGDGPKFSQLLLVNRHADSRSQLHISIFRETHPFVSSLKAGDTVRVFAISVFRAWAITVNQGTIKLVYEENEMEQILEVMSRQAKSMQNVQTIVTGDAHFWASRPHFPRPHCRPHSSPLFQTPLVETRFPSEPRPPFPVPTIRDASHVTMVQTPIRVVFAPRCRPSPQDPISLELTTWCVNDDLPDTYANLSSLRQMDLEFLPITRLPSNFHSLTNLQSLELRHCNYLHEISSLPPTLVGLDLGDSPNLQAILCLSSLKELRDLVLCNCSGLVELVGLDCLVHLSQLNITGCRRLMSLPSGLEKLTSLKSLYMAGSGVSLLQGDEPWIQKLASLELISVYGDQVPGCLLRVMVEGVREKQHANVCCMEVAVPEVDATYKAALFCFVSHDQGWSDYQRDQGRYRNSHTSMHADIIEREADRPKFSQVLFVNRHADRRNQVHISLFKASHPFVRNLNGGDKIRALAKSAYPGWAITVSEGFGKVMSEENEMDETLRALSRELSTAPPIFM